MKQFMVRLSVMLLAGFAYAAQPLGGDLDIVPTHEVMPVIVQQPDSPIQVEKFIVARGTDGRIETFYEVRNSGRKAVRSYTIARWYSDNTGYLGQGIMPAGQTQLKRVKYVGTVAGRRFNLSHNQTILTKMKKIAFIMVLEAVFSDGTKFDARRDFEALERHLESFATGYNPVHND